MKVFLWWLTWAIILAHLALIPSFAGVPVTGGALREWNLRLTAFVITPLAISTVIRWLVLLRLRSPILTFGLFSVGLILADASGLMTVFFALGHRPVLYGLCLAGIAQFTPFFARRKTGDQVTTIEAGTAIGAG